MLFSSFQFTVLVDQRLSLWYKRLDPVNRSDVFYYPGINDTVPGAQS